MQEPFHVCFPSTNSSKCGIEQFSQDIIMAASMQTHGSPSQLRELDLGFQPCSVAFTPDGQFVLVGGTSKGLRMFTTSGVPIDTVVDRSSWIWACACRPTDQATPVSYTHLTLPTILLV